MSRDVMGGVYPVRDELDVMIGQERRAAECRSEVLRRLKGLRDYAAALESRMPEILRMVRDDGPAAPMDEPVIRLDAGGDSVRLEWRMHGLTVLAYPEPPATLRQRMAVSIRLVKLAEDIGHMIRRLGLEDEVFIEFPKAVNLAGAPMLSLVFDDDCVAVLRRRNTVPVKTRIPLDENEPLKQAVKLLECRETGRRTYAAFGASVRVWDAHLRLMAGGRKELRFPAGCPYASDIRMMASSDGELSFREVGRFAWDKTGIERLKQRIAREIFPFSLWRKLTGCWLVLRRRLA